jgi:HAT1-interacting factor 1
MVASSEPKSIEEPQVVDEKSAKTMMAEGRRDFICKDYSNAAENFSKACEKLTIEFGDRSAETADGYFWYGKALLETSRNQQDFLGTKAENEDVENEDPEEEEKSASGPVEVSKQPLEKIEEKIEDSDEKSDEKVAESAENAEKPENEKSETDKPETNEETEDPAKKENLGSEEDWEDADEDEISDQQLAYEMFEMARGIYENLMDQTQETEIKRAECHMSIGEISGENGQIEEAIVEYYSALDILEKKLPEERKRRLAEVYVSLGCSQDAIYQYSKSVTSFEKAIEVMETRVEFLNSKDEESLKPADKREMISLKDTVIPELKEKIVDAKNSEKKHEEDKEMLKQVLLMKSTTSAFDAPVSSKPVTSINSLVKRKRKSAEVSSSSKTGILEPSSKK